MLPVLVLLSTLVPSARAAVEFNRDVRPILSDRCFTCHGPDKASRKSPLRLDLEESARPKLAEVARRIESTHPVQRMPPAYMGHERLPDREIAVLKQWIADGGKYQPHWAFLPPKRATPPPVRETGWARNAIDRFILARLEKDGLRHAPEASRAVLLRRLSLDLTGLPPTPEEVEAFERHGDYEKEVDRLLASPRYGERMAIRWLEAARYADTNGYQSDGPRDMYRWRDWVIGAFNRNLPFDRFTIEQLAGDLLPSPTLDQRIATAFHRNHRTSAEGGIVDEEFRIEYVADRAETTATVWLGMTMGCARCHDHKYDPIPQKDFYRLFAYFNNLPEKGFVYNFGNEPPYIPAPLPEQQQRLDEMDRRIAGAEARVRALEPEAAQAQAAWERTLAPTAPDWTVTAGLTFRDALPRSFNGKDGVQGGPDVAKFDYRDPFTFAARIRPEEKNGAILSRADDYFEGQGHALYLIEGKLRLHVIFRWTDLGMRIETRDPLPAGRRQHVAVTYDGGMKASGVHMYVDGVEQPLKILFDQNLWPLETKKPFRIGAGGGLRWRGEISDVRVYSRVLSAEEAAVIALEQPVGALAAIPAASRTAAQSAKLRMCFLEGHAPAAVREAREALAQERVRRTAFFQSLPTVMVMEEMPRPRDAFVLNRGAYDAPGEKVTPATPTALPPPRPEWPANRLGLAQWLVDRSNPLTARVTVNRFWQMLFGTGLVKTVEDFGAQGEWPTHQDLLDWLAVEFMESGWDVKRILKTIVLSAAYRQSSRVTPELLEKDPENRLLARGPRFRLPPEMVRDQALAWSGLLVEKVGGPSVKPYQPAGLWQELQGGKGYEPDKGPALYRRSLYSYWRRTVAPPSMVNFDSPTRETCVVRETRTNTPLQALNLMNDPTYLEAARKLAERLMTLPERERIPAAIRIVLARAPRAGEAAAIEKAVGRFAAYYRENPKAAALYLQQGEAPRDPRWTAAELAPWAAAANLLFNLDEAVVKE